MDEIIAINQKLVAEKSSPLKLGKIENLPHITLLQAVIDQMDLEEASSKLNELHQQFMPIDLMAYLTTSRNYMTFDIKKNERLQKLHEKVMSEFRDLVSFDAKEENCADDKINEKSLGYIREYKDKYAYNNYYPHITLSIGLMDLPNKEIAFSANRLAICHLGNYNTCKRILYEYQPMQSKKQDHNL